MYLIKNGKYYSINIDNNEPYEHFIERANFIMSQKNIKNDYNSIIIFSRIMINIKYYKSIYNKEIMDKVKEMMKLSTTV